MFYALESLFFLLLSSFTKLLVVMIFSALTLTLNDVLTLIRLPFGDLRWALGDFGIGELFSDFYPNPNIVIDFKFLDLLLDLFLRLGFIFLAISFLVVSSSKDLLSSNFFLSVWT